MLDTVAILLAIAALLAYVNQRFVGLPVTIGVMAAALSLSLVLIGLGALGLDGGLRQPARDLLRSIDFSSVLMQGMLSLLLFAGALHVNLGELRARRWQVGALAVISTFVSTAVIGFTTWIALPVAGVELPLLHCLLFGALISPTDPIAVIGILKTAGAAREIEVVMAGESLFNDGIGVVLFSLLFGVLVGGSIPTAADALTLFAREAGVGLLFGLALGYGTFRMLRSVDSYPVEVLLTLAMVVGGYALASRLHVSGPLAMVVAGLIIGNSGRALAMSDTTRHYVDLFWELVDDILNAVLFVLVGMEVLVLAFTVDTLLAAAIAAVITLAARALTVGIPLTLLRKSFDLPVGAGWIMTWGGVRGGISVALALSLPLGSNRDTVLALTYCIVVVSILVQGLTIGRLVRHYAGPASGSRPGAPR